MMGRDDAEARGQAKAGGSSALSSNRSASRIEAALAQAPAFVAIMRGSPLVFEFVNEAYYQLVGHRELLGREVFAAIPEARDQGFSELLDKVLRTGEAFVGREMPIQLARTRGAPTELRYIDFVYAPLVEADRTCSGILAHGIDVTDHVLGRREVERLLAESERLRLRAEQSEDQLRTLANAIPTLAWTATADGSIDWYNAGWYEYTDTTPEEMAGWGWTSVHDPDVLPTVLERWRASVEQGAPFEMTFPIRGADGVFRSFLTRVVPVRDGAGRVTRWFGTNTDVDTEARLRLAAESANRAKTEFLAVMSHELRTPLNAIDGYAEIMELEIRGPLTEDQRHDLARIRRSQRHLLGLIDGVLNYARVEAGTVSYDFTDVSLDEAFATCEALIAPQALTRRLALRFEPPGDTRVRADVDKLQQVLLNLLTNAVKFTDSGGSIRVSCGIVGDYVEIRVNDTGRGIAANQLVRVFEPFVQVDAQLTRTNEGVGLGLAISRDLARAMHGDLSVVSQLAVGSTLILTLPRM